MKIGIDIRSTLLKRKTGVGYYTSSLVNSLAGIDSGNSYFLYSRIRPFDFKRRLPELPGPNFTHRVDRLGFHPEIRMGDMDILHTSSYDIRGPDAARMITTIHDIIPLVFREGYPGEVLENLENNIKRVLRESVLILADSRHTKKDLEERFSPAPGKIHVLYPGRDESLKPVDNRDKFLAYLKKEYGIDREFILFTGTIEKRKNVKGLLEAFFDLKRDKRIPHILVITGMRGWGGEPALDLLNASDLKDEVRMAGYVRREDLIALYNASDLFVYPSFYEGFGLPILEAFSCGVPVITASTTSCGEIAGGAAYTIDPNDIDSLKEGICRMLNDKTLRSNLKAKGLERVKAFSWEKTAKEFKEICAEVGGYGQEKAE